MVELVWFKKDLRARRNLPLLSACLHAEVIPLYIIEDDFYRLPDISHRHYLFLVDCLKDLANALKNLGLNLIIKKGNAQDILLSLTKKLHIKRIWSYQEIGNSWTYSRDKEIRVWAKKESITWNELPSNGIVRNLRCRNQWSGIWHNTMKKDVEDIKPQKPTHFSIASDPIPSYKELNISSQPIEYIQKGGREEGLKLLNSFFDFRGWNYSFEMSSPLTAYDSCSRLSPHLAFGTLSIEEVFKKGNHALKLLETSQINSAARRRKSIYSFLKRLRWHCHFIQKMEDQPDIEYKNLHPIYDGLREDQFNEEYFQAWKRGMTGFPFVDACMRALIATGWINFRMRAMLVSFSSYHLWLHWRKPALYLARLFTDYEPGIHYSQIQMQSGTTGINTIRAYNPIKQSFDQDKEGKFIQRWVPELAHYSSETIHTPWIHPDQLNGYPTPIVDEQQARAKAVKAIYLLRKSKTHKAIAGKIVIKHASRKRIKFKADKKHDLNQLELPL